MVRPERGFDPLLSRPFSIFSADEGRFRILYSIVGRGTAMLARQRPGDRLVVLGPLGQGFSREHFGQRSILVAGGIGIAGLRHLALELAESGSASTLLYGARTAEAVVASDEFRRLGVDVQIATDDGTDGHHGFVTDLLVRLLEGAAGEPVIYACGPSPMLRLVREVAIASSVRCELAMEAHMACGFGICLGCAVPSATAPGSFRLVCTDGPCIEAREVLP